MECTALFLFYRCVEGLTFSEKTLDEVLQTPTIFRDVSQVDFDDSLIYFSRVSHKSEKTTQIGDSCKEGRSKSSI